MNMNPTGNGRRQNYRFAPTSRMTNTHIAAGHDTDMISGIDNGLYAKKDGRRQRQPADGRIQLRRHRRATGSRTARSIGRCAATLIGKGSEIIQRIDAVGPDMSMGQGMCGSISAACPQTWVNR